MLEPCFERFVFVTSSAVLFTFDVCSSVLSFLQLSFFATTLNWTPQVGSLAVVVMAKQNSELFSSLC